MKKLFACLGLILACGVVWPQQPPTTISALPAAQALTGTENIPGDQGTCTSCTVKITPLQLATFTFNNGVLGITHGGTGATSFATAKLPQFLGSPVAGNCVEWLSSSVIEDAGMPCGTGGGGTPGGSNYQLQYNASGV